MSRHMLFFISVIMIIFMGCNKKDEPNKSTVLSEHPAKPIILRGTYKASVDHKKEKKRIKKKIKKIDTVINKQFDQLKDWVSNVGQAIEMME